MVREDKRWSKDRSLFFPRPDAEKVGRMGYTGRLWNQGEYQELLFISHVDLSLWFCLSRGGESLFPHPSTSERILPKGKNEAAPRAKYRDRTKDLGRQGGPGREQTCSPVFLPGNAELKKTAMLLFQIAFTWEPLWATPENCRSPWCGIGCSTVLSSEGPWIL